MKIFSSMICLSVFLILLTLPDSTCYIASIGIDYTKNSPNLFAQSIRSMSSNLFNPLRASTTSKPVLKNLVEQFKIIPEALPWKQSVSATTSLTYMPMFESQLNAMNILGMENVQLEEKFIHQTSQVRPARIANLCFKNDMFRMVRMSYFDGGDAVQVSGLEQYNFFNFFLIFLIVLNRFLIQFGIQILNMIYHYLVLI